MDGGQMDGGQMDGGQMDGGSVLEFYQALLFPPLALPRLLILFR